MWRSKLGNSYSMADIQRNDNRSKAELDQLRNQEGNSHCADCGKKGTVWASINLGVFLCMRCGALHRGLGTHISVPKGCTGTYFWGPDEIEQMRNHGNTKARQKYGGDDFRPTAESSDMEWKRFLAEKYEQQKFAPKEQFHQKNPLHNSSAGTANSTKNTSFGAARNNLVFTTPTNHTTPTNQVFPAQQAKNTEKLISNSAAQDDFFGYFGV